METVKCGRGLYKKKELTNSHRACHSSDQTSAHWTELFTLSQESNSVRNELSSRTDGFMQVAPLLTMLHATANWWASLIQQDLAPHRSI